MLSSVSSHSTFGHFLNIFGHQGIKKKIPQPALANNVSVHRTISVRASTSSANKARGGLPRFYSEQLPASKGFHSQEHIKIESHRVHILQVMKTPSQSGIHCGDSMLSSVSSHSTFGHFLNIFGHQGIKKKIPQPALANNVSVHRTISVRASTSSANKARGGLPRFYSEQLPASKDKIVRMEGEESWHMTRVLRLCVTDRVELFNGQGEIVGGQIVKVDRSGVYIVAVEDPVTVTPSGAQWHVVAAFGTLKGGRADWLVEKSTELGASSITPLLTERSTLISENRVDRWQRVMLAALKQCQRLHQMVVKAPVGIDCILPQITASSLTFLAMAEAIPLVDALSVVDKKAGGLLLVGPEGDFTDKEVEALTKAGAIPVGLGPRRLRVETATITLLAGAMLWTDVEHVGS